MTPNQTAREKRVDEILAQEQAARDAESRSAIHAKLVEEERRAAEAEEHAKISAAKAAFLERTEVAYPQACLEYKQSVDAFREARLRLGALVVPALAKGTLAIQRARDAVKTKRAQLTAPNIDKADAVSFFNVQVIDQTGKTLPKEWVLDQARLVGVMAGIEKARS